jgi:hypothetical protein
MADCLGKFKDDVDKVVGRHESVLRSLMLFTGAYREVTASDVYIGGLITSNCEVYKYRELGYEEYHGLAGFCGDELFDIENVGQPYLRGLNTVMHEKVYSRLPETSIWLLHDMKERRIPVTVDSIGATSTGSVNIYVPAEKLFETARRFKLPRPEVFADLLHGSVAVMFKSQKRGLDCAVKYITQRYSNTGPIHEIFAEGDCPQNFKTSRGLCTVLDVLVELLEEAVNLHEKVTLSGIRFATTYLLY